MEKLPKIFAENILITFFLLWRKLKHSTPERDETVIGGERLRNK